jgi:peptide/nickel transport system permease protein
MSKYLIRRVAALIPVLLGISVLVFFLVHLIPGDPVQVMLGERATPEIIEQVRKDMGFDQPLYVQYFDYLGRVMRGDLGKSIFTRNEIAEELKSRFPATIELAGTAMLIAVLVGIPAGIISAARPNSMWDKIAMVGALLGVSTPTYLSGILLIWVFALIFPILPPGGRLDVQIDLTPITHFYILDSIITGNLRALGNTLKHLTLPAVCMATWPVAILARMTRSAMLEVLHADYVRTARSKGLSSRVVLIRHALRNALLPIITVVGLQMGALLGGAVLLETIFAWPGIGNWIFDAIQGRDYTVVQSMTLVAAVVFVVMNLIVDFAYTFFDPRIRYD